MNFSKVTEPDIWMNEHDKMEPTNKMGLVLGAEAEYQLHDRVSCSVGLLYSQQGSKYRDIGNEYRNHKSSLDYLNMPLTVGVYLADGLAIRSGIQLGYALSKRTHMEERQANNLWVTTEVPEGTNWYRRWDVSLPIALSYDINRLRLDLRYNLGLNYITHYGSTIPERNRVLQFTVGYLLKR